MRVAPISSPSLPYLRQSCMELGYFYSRRLSLGISLFHTRIEPYASGLGYQYSNQSALWELSIVMIDRLTYTREGFSYNRPQAGTFTCLWFLCSSSLPSTHLQVRGLGQREKTCNRSYFPTTLPMGTTFFVLLRWTTCRELNNFLLRFYKASLVQ